MTVALNRDSTDSQVLTAFRKVVKRVHPDKGGCTEHVQQLHAAKDAWQGAARQSKARIRAIFKSKKANTKAANTFKGFRKTCKIVIKKRGAHSGR